MKTVIILLITLTGLFLQQTFNQQDLIGKWSVLKAYGETNKLCDKNSPKVKDFILTFLSNNEYEFQTNNGEIYKAKGKYTVDIKTKTIKLNSTIGKQTYSEDIPLISLTRDKLVIIYSLCTFDTTSNASNRIELTK